MDNELQKALKANSEAQELGHPEFIRRALQFYLRVNEQAKIRHQYQKGYCDADLTELALEMQDWGMSKYGPNLEIAATSISTNSKGQIKPDLSSFLAERMLFPCS